MATNWYGATAKPKRKVFVSYHHGGDQAYYDELSRVFCDTLDVFSDRSLDRARDSDDPEYIMRYIRENHLTGASTLIVLCGPQTRWRKYVDWEIRAGLAQGMALIGVNLPTNPVAPNGMFHKPDRLQDNIDSGYAIWTNWVAFLQAATDTIETANMRPKSSIVNHRARRLRNG